MTSNLPCFRVLCGVSVNVVLLCCVVTNRADANGINPPRPAQPVEVEASCTEKKSGAITVLKKARLLSDESGGSLEVMLDAKPRGAPAQRVELGQINKIVFAGKKPTKDGFVKAMLDLIEPNFSGEGLVRIRQDKTSIILSGFRDTTERVELPIERCRKLVFMQRSPITEVRKDVPKLPPPKPVTGS